MKILRREKILEKLKWKVRKVEETKIDMVSLVPKQFDR